MNIASHHIISIVSFFQSPHHFILLINTHSICIYKRSAPSWTLYPEPNAINEAAPRGSDLSWGDHEAICLTSRPAMGMVRFSSPVSLLFLLLHILLPPLPNPSQSLLPITPLLPIILPFPLQNLFRPLPPPPPTKTKRYTPLHLMIQPL